jgi:hypothetical protein
VHGVATWRRQDGIFCAVVYLKSALRARKLRISNKRLHSSPGSRGGHRCGQVIRVALVVVAAVMMVMVVVVVVVAVTGVAAPFSPAPSLGATRRERVVTGSSRAPQHGRFPELSEGKSHISDRVPSKPA